MRPSLVHGEAVHASSRTCHFSARLASSQAWASSVGARKLPSKFFGSPRLSRRAVMPSSMRRRSSPSSIVRVLLRLVSWRTPTVLSLSSSIGRAPRASMTRCMPRTAERPAAVPASSALESGAGDSVIPSTGIGAVGLPLSARCTARGRRTVVASTRWSSCLAMSRGIGRAGSASMAASRVVPRPLERDRVSRTFRSSSGSSAMSSGLTWTWSRRDQPVGRAGMTSGGMRMLP